MAPTKDRIGKAASLNHDGCCRIRNWGLPSTRKRFRGPRTESAETAPADRLLRPAFPRRVWEVSKGADRIDVDPCFIHRLQSVFRLFSPGPAEQHVCARRGKLDHRSAFSDRRRERQHAWPICVRRRHRERHPVHVRWLEAGVANRTSAKRSHQGEIRFFILFYQHVPGSVQRAIIVVQNRNVFAACIRVDNAFTREYVYATYSHDL